MTNDLYSTGIRPLIDEYLKGKEKQTNPDYWRASSAGYCYRYNIMKRLNIPAVPERQEDLAIRTRVFEAGRIFHKWLQGITEKAGVALSQELELKDEKLKLVGHFDDLVLVSKGRSPTKEELEAGIAITKSEFAPANQSINETYKNLILYDYKTAHSKAFNYPNDEMSYYHKMQLGTYMYMLRELGVIQQVHHPDVVDFKFTDHDISQLSEARLLQLSKDDLRMREWQLLWSPELRTDITSYWQGLNEAWDVYQAKGTRPPCTCLSEEKDSGWFGRRSKFGKVWNDYFWQGEPCSEVWFRENVNKVKEKKVHV